jgi:hypothetical protein
MPYLTLYFISVAKGNTCSMSIVWSPLSRGWVIKSQHPKYLIYPYLLSTSWHFTEQTCKGILRKTLNIFFRLRYCWVT